MAHKQFPDAEKELILSRYARKATEYTLACAALLIGVLFVAVPAKLSGSIINALFAFLPPLFWGLLFMMIGTVRVVMLWVNGHHPQGPLVRGWLSGVCLIFLWLPLSVVHIVRGLEALVTNTTGLYLGIASFPVLFVSEAAILLLHMTWWKLINNAGEGVLGDGFAE